MTSDTASGPEDPTRSTGGGAPSERAAITASFARLGPGAPTILPGWDALELMDHLLVRERLPHLMVGAKLPGALGARARAQVSALEDQPWERKLALLAEGPPSWSPVGRVDAFSGQAELLIHHEDLRRAEDAWRPRRLDVAEQQAAWRATGLFARGMMRVPTRVTLVSPLGGRQVGARRADSGLRVHGEPLELLLWVSGRDRVARVQVLGDEEALRALRDGRRGV